MGIGEIILGALILYFLTRIFGTLLIVLKFLVKSFIYCAPISFCLGVAIMNPWWLILCIPLSVGYYYLVSKITRFFRRRKYVIEWWRTFFFLYYSIPTAFLASLSTISFNSTPVCALTFLNSIWIFFLAPWTNSWYLIVYFLFRFQSPFAQHSMPW